MNPEDDPTQRKVDQVRVRCVFAFLLSIGSLCLVLRGEKLSLIPMMLGLSLITRGKELKGRNEPPLTFLLVGPIGIAIAVILLHRG